MVNKKKCGLLSKTKGKIYSSYQLTCIGTELEHMLYQILIRSQSMYIFVLNW